MRGSPPFAVGTGVWAEEEPAGGGLDFVGVAEVTRFGLTGIWPFWAGSVMVPPRPMSLRTSVSPRLRPRLKAVTQMMMTARMAPPAASQRPEVERERPWGVNVGAMAGRGGGGGASTEMGTGRGATGAGEGRVLSRVPVLSRRSSKSAGPGRAMWGIVSGGGERKDKGTGDGATG